MTVHVEKVKDEPIKCIYCGSNEIHADTIDGCHFSRKVYCDICDRGWSEVFEFIGIIRDEVH